METVINVVAAAILDADNNLLCAQRGKEDRYPFRWEFPGGKIEKGESSEDAMVRELKEELSIKVDVLERITTTIFPYTDFQLNLTLFDVCIKEGTIHPNVHHQIKWVPLHELDKLEWLPADFPLIETVIEYYNERLN